MGWIFLGILGVTLFIVTKTKGPAKRQLGTIEMIQLREAGIRIGKAVPISQQCYIFFVPKPGSQMPDVHDPLDRLDANNQYNQLLSHMDDFIYVASFDRRDSNFPNPYVESFGIV